MSKPHEIFLKDYTPSNYLIEHTYLNIELHPEYTLVKSILKMVRNPKAEPNATLSLDGEALQLRAILLNGKALAPNQFEVQPDKLIIPNLPAAFTLETEVLIKPAENKALSGLYQSKGNYCTQCEAQGFRRITYFLDRPDILTQFTTTITADRNRYPVLLSNGNLVDTQMLDDNRHWVKWEDPSLKPCYLFALVAGDYEWLEDVFVTMSQRPVKLRVYVEKGKVEQSHFAMESLKRAMRWDEETYGREYDLDMYMIVAVSDFNMGAMENKGLNIFNDRYILAKPQTATDDDYINVESVIGHEYFHNWSGNRVTVRDWFQITLKEGLTIFRDQNFTADMTSRAVKRIKDVNVMRNVQFPQDRGPLAHPIRPDSYIEVNNFYTVTVYNKGAEVIRMLETILGKQTFRQAMNLYFERNDGQAVTTEDFVEAMENASGRDLTQFRRWYHQAGTPCVKASGYHNEKEKTFTLYLKQSCPPTPGQAHKDNLVIPLRMALLNSQGQELPLKLRPLDSDQVQSESEATEKVLLLKDSEATFIFQDINEPPLPSLLRDFSAPVKLNYPYSNEDLIFLMSHDTDGFNAWDAGQQLFCTLITDRVKHYPACSMDLKEEVVAAFRHVLNSTRLDNLLIAEMFNLPAEPYLLELLDCPDITHIYEVKRAIRKYLAAQLCDDFLQLYTANQAKAFSLGKEAMEQRRLKNLSLSYLLLLEEKNSLKIAMNQFEQSDNLTDTLGVLTPLTHFDCSEREQAFKQFFDQAQTEPLVLDKWFALQALSTLPNTFQVVKSLMEHPAFDLSNPNKVRALLGTFANYNYLRFHDKSGEPYAFLADQLLTLDAFNPHLAARLIEPLVQWRNYDKERQGLMKEQLERIAKVPKLSKDLYEIVTKSLALT
jgi:aminopeptidase N